MHKVANKAIIRKISFRTMEAKRGKNSIAIMAIALTSLMFTSLFTVGGSMLTSMQEATMRQVGTSSHGGYKNMTEEEYNKIKDDPAIKEISYNIVVGFAVNPELSEIQTEVRYAEDENAKWGFSYPQVGEMPRTGKECAASTKVLDALGIPHEIDAQVPLQIEGAEEMQETFILSGYWESNEASFAQEFWVSREWCDAHTPKPTENYYDTMGDPYGYLQPSIYFPSAFNIEKQLQELTLRSGLDPEVTNMGPNWAYGMASVDVSTLFMVVMLLLIIMLSGYLIIYNIFYINVSADIRYYGLLKTVGTTGRQLRRIVRGQALLLAAVGIPLGLFGGWFVGRGILPFLYRAINTDGVRRVALNPWIFIGAALFSLLVVIISCSKPCRLAARVSPMEAVRYTEQTATAKKEKKTGKISMWRLGLTNMGRNRKKTIVVVASLALGIVLMNSTYTLVKSFDFNQYVKNYLVGDFMLTHDGIANVSSSYKAYDAITPEVLEDLRNMEGVTSVETLYVNIGKTVISEENRKQFEQFINREGDNIENRRWWQDEADIIIETGEKSNNIYGINEEMFTHLKVLEGTIDIEKFRSGGYVICGHNLSEMPWLKVGDKIICRNLDGSREKELEVMAMVDIPYAIQTRSYPGFFVMELMMEENAWLDLMTTVSDGSEQGGLHAIINVQPDKETEVSAALTDYAENLHPELTLITKESLREEFDSETSMFSSVGNVLGFILALIGILNFINAIITGILTRRQEFAMMEAVGMTGRQLRTMLIWEGLCYAFMTILFSLTIGNVIGYALVWAMGRGMAFFTWHFTMLPILISIPVMIVISIIVPAVCYAGMCRKSVVERLRLAEV